MDRSSVRSEAGSALSNTPQEKQTANRKEPYSMKMTYTKPGYPLAAAMLLGVSATLPARADYPTTVLSQGPAAYWRLNETASTQPPITTAANLGSLGSGENGTYNGAQGFFRGAPGALLSSDTAAFFDGSSQDVQAPFAAALNQSTFSYEAWVAPDFVGGAVPGGLTCVASCGDFASPRAGWLIYQSTTGYTLRLYNQNGTAFTISLDSGTPLVAGVYHHLCATFDGTTARIYLDGVLKNSGNPSGSPVYVPGTAGVFSIGVRSDNGFFWKGKEDEVAYYNTVLSASTIAAHFSAATTNAPGYAAQIQAAGPLLYYRLNETGDPLVSNSGSLGAAAQGDLVYPATTGAIGPIPPAEPGFDAANKAFDFSAGGYMQARALNLNTNGVTITCWLNPNGSQPASAGLVFHRTTTAIGGAYTSTAGLVIDQGGGLQLSYNWDGDTFGAFLSGVNLTDSAWNFASLTVFPNYAVIFVPGQTPATNFNVHASLKFEGTTYLAFDPYNNLASSTRKYNGKIDEVAVFGRSLSMGEVYSQYGAAVGNVAPAIFSSPVPPANQLYAGDTLTLTVDAGGTPGLTYQWRKNSLPLGVNSSTYTVASATTADTGNYDVVVSNASGTTNSAAASVSVLPAISPIITQNIPYTSRTLYTNGTLILNAAGTGGGVTYQWKKNGTAITGATTTALTIPGLNGTNAGAYKLTVSNGSGSIDSATMTLSIASPIAASYEAFVSAANPVSWWRLDDQVGSPLMLDAMGRADGFYTNLSAGPTLGVPGALAGDANKAVHFDLAGKGWGEVTTPPVTTGDFTFECWARTTNTTDGLCPLSSFRNQYGNNFQRTSDGVWRSYGGYGETDAGVGERQDAMGNSVSGQWTHLVIIYSGATAQKNYYNGVWDNNGPFVDNSRNLNTPLRIGCVGPYPGELNVFMSGEVDEVAIYNRALTDAEILSHYQSAQFPPGTAPFFTQLPQSQTVVSNPATTVTFVGTAQGSYPVTYQWLKNGSPISGATTTTISVSAAYSNAALYQLTASNGSGSTNATASLSIIPPNPPFVNITNNLVLHLKFDGNYLDSSGRGNNATAVAAPTIVAGRLGSGALQFVSDGSTENYLTLGTPSDLKFSSNVNFTVAYWVQIPFDIGGFPATNGDLPFLCSAVGSYGNPGLTFAPSYKLGGWSYSLNGVAQLYGPNNSINNGNWHHLVHSFDRTGFGVTYLDGVAVDTRTVTAVGDVDTAGPINIGQDPTGTYPEIGTDNIDDMAVWRRALTAYEAYGIYYAATNGNRSFDTPGTVSLKIAQVGSNITLSWVPGTSLGTLEQADDLTGPWTAVAGVYVPTYTTPASAARKFYRVHF
jgi:hypothetical protein